MPGPLTGANTEGIRVDQLSAPPAGAQQCSLAEKILSAPVMPFAVTGLFLISLMVWANLDHSVPLFDAAVHSLDSSAVKQWLCRPKGWNIDALLNLLRLQPTYPAGVWFFNGACKVVLGDNKWTEHVILGIHLVILCSATWWLSLRLLGDRLKANLAVLFVNCSPLILGLQHSPLVDLGLVAFYAAFMCALVNWWQSPTWTRTLLAGGLLGFFCLTKQIAILYAAPVLAVMFVILLLRKQFKELGQLFTIGVCAGVFLASWVLPNFAFLVNFAKVRGATSGFDKSQVVTVTIQYLYEILQSFSPLMFCATAAGMCRTKASDYMRLWPVLVSGLGSIALVLAAAFSNGSTSPRFTAPLMVVLALLLASGVAAFIRSSLMLRSLALGAIMLAVTQAFTICFQQAPVNFTYKNPLPIYRYLGLKDSFFGMTLPYYRSGDPWKQEWLLELIENEEMGRPVYLNTLVGANQYNEGTLNFLSQSRKNQIHVVTWRTNRTTTTDSFDYTDDALRVMQWFLFKTGNQAQGFVDDASRIKYQGLLARLNAKNGQFVESANEELPDGTRLILYRNKAWIWRGLNKR